MSTLDVANFTYAGFPFLGVKTLEPLRVERMIREEIEDCEDLSMYKWDVIGNFYDFNNGDVQISEDVNFKEAIERFCSQSNSVMVINNINDLMNPQTQQILLNKTNILKSRHLTVIFVDCSFTKVKPDIMRLISFLDVNLPTVEELLEIATMCYSSVKDDEDCEDMTDQDLQWIAENSRGLTEFEAENIFAKSIAENGKIVLDDVLEKKSDVIKENAALEVYKGSRSFKDIGGLEPLKEFCIKTVNSQYAKGSMLLGVAGCGKSELAKALAVETNRWCVVLKFGRLFDKYVGGTEERIDLTLKTINSLGKIVLFIDEFDKAIGSSLGGGSKTTGNEVSMRAIGSFLSWMQDKEAGDVYVIVTCNDALKMASSNPELLRAGRFDTIFFVDLPNKIERKVICDIYRKVYDISDYPTDSKIDGYSGAEIEQLYRTSKMLNISLDQATNYVICLKDTAKESIEELRKWAKGRTVPSSLSVPQAAKKIVDRKIKTGVKKRK